MERGLTADQKDALEKSLKDDAESIQEAQGTERRFTAGLTAMDQKHYDVAIASLKRHPQIDPKQPPFGPIWRTRIWRMPPPRPERIATPKRRRAWTLTGRRLS